MKIIISHPHGNPNTIKVASLLDKLNLLDSFWTTIAFPFRFFFNKRFFNEIRFKKIRIHFTRELFRNIFKILNLKNLYFFEESYFSVYSIYKDFDIKVSKYLIKNYFCRQNCIIKRNSISY